MKKIVFTLAFSFLLLNVFAQRNSYTINEQWKFAKGDVEEAATTDFNDSDWEEVHLPHTWNNEDAIDEEPGYYRGKSWYRKGVFVGKETENKQVYIYFEGANQVTTLWVNGEYIGEHEGGYTRFAFNVTDALNVGEMNQFSIQVDNAHDDMIIPLSADFTFFGGIYRDVYLTITEEVHLSLAKYASSGVYISTPEVSEDSAEIKIEALVDNFSGETKTALIQHILYSPEGEKLAESSNPLWVNSGTTGNSDIQYISLENPELWSPDTPHLYQVVTKVYDENGDILWDEMSNPVGIRWFEFDAENGFFLNGESLKLIGTNRHQGYENQGNALRDEMHVRDVKLLKEMGGNFLRVSHYPQDPVIMEMCDRLGIITSVEIPSVNRITESEEFFENSAEMAREMIHQNYNHPSVMIWNYMNEIMLRPPYDSDSEEYDAYADSVAEYGKNLEKLIREEDPSRRTMLVFHGALSAYEKAQLVELPQLVGWNLYQGWYGGEFEGFDGFLDNFHEKYPEIPVFVSEYGAGADPRLHSFEPERFDFTIEYANEYHEHYLKAIMERPFVNGANIWNLNDFHSEYRGDAVPNINSKGITTLSREWKDTYRLYKARFSDDNVVLLGNKNWIYRGGIADENGVTIQPNKVYTNAESVEFIHNGNSLGKKAVNDNIAEFDVPFINGMNNLEAVATFNGTTVRDLVQVNFSQVPGTFTPETEFTELNVTLGSKRYFEDDVADMVWIPEKPYNIGSWGFIGGETKRPGTRFGSLPASDIDIKNTDQDPIFQTQREGIEGFKMDVEQGKYAVYLYLAELDSENESETLAYNLGNDQISEEVQARVFDILINGNLVLDNLDLANHVGAGQAVIKKFMVEAEGNEGIDIKFHPERGKPVLNAIRVYKVH